MSVYDPAAEPDEDPAPDAGGEAAPVGVSPDEDFGDPTADTAGPADDDDEDADEDDDEDEPSPA